MPLLSWSMASSPPAAPPAGAAAGPSSTNRAAAPQAAAGAVSVSRLLAFELEGDLGVDPEVLDLVVLDGGLELLDVDGGDPVQGPRGLLDHLAGRVLPALLALAQQFDDLHHGHGVPPPRRASRSRLGEAAPAAEAPSTDWARPCSIRDVSP